MTNKEVVLDGFWQFGFSETETKPCCDAVCPVPVCADALTEHFGKTGYASFVRTVRAGGEVRLRVTAGLHCTVYWDGAVVGTSALAWTREEYDFDAGEEGDHELWIVTDNISDQTPSSVYRNFYDFYGYCGLYDKVTLERLVPGAVDRIFVTPKGMPADSVELRIHAVAPHPQTLSVAFDGNAAVEHPWCETLTLSVPDARQWSPEHPHLHRVTVNGMEVEFGLRTLDWSGRRLLLNGREVKLKGVNRHEAHPEFGPATPEALIWNDLLSIKRKGFNFIRGAHYPQREFTLACADRLGLLYWEEALGWGNRDDAMSDAVFCDRQEAQVRKMVRKSYNHPCVIIWAFLNECWGFKDEAIPLTTRLRDVIHSMDSSRPVTFATCVPDKDKCIRNMDIIAINTYPDWYDTDVLVKDMSAIGRRLQWLAELYPEKPLIVSEIGCGAIYGDHSGMRWSEEYHKDYVTTVLKEIKSRDDFTGVSLWQFCDMRTTQTSQSVLSTPRGFNNKGLVNEYRLPKIAWRGIEDVLAD